MVAQVNTVQEAGVLDETVTMVTQEGTVAVEEDTMTEDMVDTEIKGG